MPRATTWPLQATGTHAASIVAFMRRNGSESLLVIVPRLVHALIEGENWPVGRETWGDTDIALPQGQWRDLVSGTAVEGRGGRVPIGELLAVAPIAVLRANA